MSMASGILPTPHRASAHGAAACRPAPWRTLSWCPSPAERSFQQEKAGQYSQAIPDFMRSWSGGRSTHTGSGAIWAWRWTTNLPLMGASIHWQPRGPTSCLNPLWSSLKARQRDCFRIVDVLNETGLIQPMQFESPRIEPSFFRLTAAWRKGSQEDLLRVQLRQRGCTAELGPVPVRLIYRQPAFLAQYRRRISTPPQCLVAERQAHSRFALVRDNDTTYKDCPVPLGREHKCG